MKDDEAQRLFDEGQLVRAPVIPRTAEGPAPAPHPGQAGPDGLMYLTVDVGEQDAWTATVVPLLTLERVRDLVAEGRLVKSPGEPRPISRPRSGRVPGRYISVGGDPGQRPSRAGDAVVTRPGRRWPGH